MVNHKPKSTKTLLVRSLQPSTASVVLCLVFGSSLTLLHILGASIQDGTLLPGIFDGQFGTLYTNIVVGPISRFLHSSSYATLDSAVFWSVTGLVVYQICSLSYDGLRNWRHSSSMASFTTTNREMRNSYRKDLLLRSAWRLTLGILFVLVLLLVRPLYRHINSNAHDIISGNLHASLLIPIVSEWLWWTLLLQILVIFARLYSFRTRLLHADVLH